MPRVPDHERPPSLDELARAVRLVREMRRRDDSLLLATPLGGEAAAYLRQKRRRLTKSSYRDYAGGMMAFVAAHADLELRDFEGAVGHERIEEHLDLAYGSAAPRTLNKNLSILKDFFRWCVMTERMHTDPTLRIERARSREVHRETFTADQVRAIVAGQEDARDRIAIRLLLDFGLRKGSLAAVQFKHFDHLQRRLTVFSKGGKVRTLPIPSKPFWHDLERHIVEVGAEPHHFLLCRQKTIPYGPPDERGHRKVRMNYFPDKPMSGHGLHRWWYAALARAGVVPEGTSSGARMHRARHTAGQRVLDATGGNLKAAQKLLGHSSIQTTADVYVDWDLDALAATMAHVLGEGDE